jgi:hypothetical protein
VSTETAPPLEVSTRGEGIAQRLGQCAAEGRKVMGASASTALNGVWGGTDSQPEQSSEVGFTPAEELVRMTFHRTGPCPQGRSAFDALFSGLGRSRVSENDFGRPTNTS